MTETKDEYTYFFDEAEFQQYKESCNTETEITDDSDKGRPDRTTLLNVDTYLDSTNAMSSGDQCILDLSTTKNKSSLKMGDFGSKCEHSNTEMDDIPEKFGQHNTKFENLPTKDISDRDLYPQTDGNACNYNTESIKRPGSGDRMPYNSVPQCPGNTYEGLNHCDNASFTGGTAKNENSNNMHSCTDVSPLTQIEVNIKQTLTDQNDSSIPEEAREPVVGAQKSVVEGETAGFRCNEEQHAINTSNFKCNCDRGCIQNGNTNQANEHRNHFAFDSQNPCNLINRASVITPTTSTTGTSCSHNIHRNNSVYQSEIPCIYNEMNSSCNLYTDNGLQMRDMCENLHDGTESMNSRTLNHTIDLTMDDNYLSRRKHLDVNNMKHKVETESFSYPKRPKMATDSENIRCPKYDIFFAEILKHYLPVGNLSCGTLKCNKDYYSNKLEDITSSLLAGFTKAHAAFLERSKNVIKIKNTDHITNNDLHNMCSHFMAELVQFTVEFSHCIRAFGILSKEQQKIQVKQSLLEMSVIYSAYWYSERSSDLLLETYGLDALKQRIIRVGPMGELLHNLNKTISSLKLLQLKTNEFILMATMVLLSPDRSGSTTEAKSHLRKLEEIACVTLKWNMLSVHGPSANALFERTVRKLVDIRFFSELHLQSFLLSRLG